MAGSGKPEVTLAEPLAPAASAVAPSTPPGPAIKVPAIAVPDQPVPLFNREFSWLEFNRRVLAEAEDPTVPLLERLKFIAITSNNLDEFFMVRVGGIRDLVTAGVVDRSADGLTPKQQLKGIRERSKKLLLDMYRCLTDSVLPELASQGILIEHVSDLGKKEQKALEEYFRRNIAPILTPLAIDPGHPFPVLQNLALSVAITLESAKGEEHVVLLKVPSLLPRVIPVPEDANRFILVEDLIAQHVKTFFPGLKVRKVVPFRFIRNADLSISEDEVQDLLKTVETELRRRERKDVVTIEISANADESLVEFLTSATRTTLDDVFLAPGMLRLSDLTQVLRAVSGKSSLRDRIFNPRIPSQLVSAEDIFSLIRSGDILLHRPYDSFTPIVELLQAAAEDPDVVAIKMTLYRMDDKSPIVAALAAAAISGKQVTVLVELQARFDEQRNIAWARQLEDAGVQVVYGLVGIKTHCKVCVIVRREAGDLRRYVHLSTGNYNATTARLYTDIDLFTTDEGMGEDASQIMNLLTGFSIASVQEIFDGNAPDLSWKRIIVAPLDYHRWTLEMIEREVRFAKEGKPAQIIAKLNSLVDPVVIQTLYRASRAGVQIDLIVRGICCLVPGVDGLSDNIRVVSVIDRFLEHSRIFLFRNGGNTEVYLASGDWMPRNFFRRLEVTYPILEPALRKRVEEQILAVALSDNVKAWKLNSEGSYKRRTPPEQNAVRSQERFIELARSEAVRLGPYDEIMAKPGTFRRKMKKLKKKSKGKS